MGIPAAFLQQRHSPIVRDAAVGPGIDWARVAIVFIILASAIVANVLMNTQAPELGDRLPVIGLAVWAALFLTAGWRKPVNELYPSDPIIALAIEQEIPFTTASDAHSHVQLGENYQRLAEKMTAAGIQEVAVYDRHQRTLKRL